MNLDFLRHPKAKAIINIDDPTTDQIHREIVISKPFLVEVYRDFYNRLLAPFGVLEHKKIIEIGAGGFNGAYFYKEIIPTDLNLTEHVVQQVDAQNLPFEPNQLDGIICLHTLHHLPRPEMFFKEALRCLKPNGKLVMIEPYFSIWGHLIYKYLHHEPISNAKEWELPTGDQGRLSQANGKMPYNIFVRDKLIFSEKFPRLTVRTIEVHNCILYLASGGLSFKNLVPNFLIPVLFFVEILLTPFRRLLGMSMTIEIQKISQ